ncbi:agglutination protein [Legionella beliardensis]|uniref:Agglutination protein n=1 Tax=Legionella beliardensis TaxID=91822 RepID=A0A378I1V7_9GAMM|nr:SPOR domain-containing protein [Legionella beliardensis]STX28626.1 agglutination protein [Legionella beliardensis]
MKLLVSVFLALPFLYTTALSAASQVSYTREYNMLFGVSGDLTSLDSLSLSITPYKGTKRVSSINHQSFTKGPAAYLIDIGESPRLSKWQEKINAFLNTDTNALRLRPSAHPLLVQEKLTASNTTAKKATNSRWFIKTGHFKTKANAIALANRLKRLGFKVFAQPLKKGASILIGPYEYRFHATSSMEALKEIAHVQGALVNFTPERWYG